MGSSHIHVTNQNIKAQDKKDRDYSERGEAHVTDRDGDRRDITVEPYAEIMKNINQEPPDPTGNQLRARMAEGRTMARLYNRLLDRTAVLSDSDDRGRRKILFGKKQEDTGLMVDEQLAREMGLNPNNYQPGDII